MAKNRHPRKDQLRHERIKYELARRGLSLAQIARQAGVGISAVSSVSIGRSRSTKIEQHLASALNMDAAQLFPERYPDTSKGAPK
ncbi:helix-turn-helix domain-containing protein [Martelella sp. FOR1707]